MSPISDLAPDTRPLPLPRPMTAAGKPRRLGVEVEFSGLTEEQVAGILTEVLGGRAHEQRPGRWLVEDSRLGRFEVYLDSRPLEALHHDGLGNHIRDLARAVVPVEIVSDPLQVDDLAPLDEAMAALREAGAEGTGAGMLSGFGLHFNPEVVSLDFADVAPVLTAHALIEDHLRRRTGTDLARRLMTWVDPYPRTLVDRLAARDAPADMTALMDTYLRLAPTRNHGLDMMCIFAEIDRPRVARSMDMELISPRPTYHWRLPDCRIDEPDWSLALEWNRWVLVEQVAENPALLERLKEAWRDHRASLTSIRADWAWRSGGLLEGAGL